MCTIRVPVGLVLGAHCSGFLAQLRSKRVHESTEDKDHIFHLPFKGLRWPSATTTPWDTLLPLRRLRCGCRCWRLLPDGCGCGCGSRHSLAPLAATAAAACFSTGSPGTATRCGSLLNWLLHFLRPLPFTTAAIFLLLLLLRFCSIFFILSRSLSAGRLFFLLFSFLILLLLLRLFFSFCAFCFTLLFKAPQFRLLFIFPSY